VETPVESVLRRQNRDGGWPFGSGASWTEPTVFATLAALAAGRKDAALRAIDWLRRLERPDGGFAPQPAVEESTWVTSLVALLPPEELGGERHQRAVGWLLRLTGRETSRMYRLRQFLAGDTAAASQTLHGWPWFPGTAAWVGPTSFAMLALGQEQRRRPDPGLAERLDLGRQFLLSRMCADGGWNHGAARALGYEAQAYPETTGMALLALRGVRSPALDRALQAGSRFLADCRSCDAQNWLRLGLMAHGSLPAGYDPAPLPARTNRDRAVALLANQAAAGKDAFQ